MRSAFENQSGSDARDAGPDMTFCEIYGLGQYGREGDIVGLVMAMTAWNVAEVLLPWHDYPEVTIRLSS